MLDENFNDSFFKKGIKLDATTTTPSFFEPQTYKWVDTDDTQTDNSNFFDGKEQKLPDFLSINEPQFPTPTLKKYNIRTKSEWKEWLRKNHVDKGGNNEECARVIEEGTELFKPSSKTQYQDC
jgi:hypothetical protein